MASDQSWQLSEINLGDLDSQQCVEGGFDGNVASNMSPKSAARKMNESDIQLYKVPGLDFEVDLVNDLGKGSFGVVYKGVCNKTDKSVAVKKISTPDLNFVNDVMKELQVLRKIPPHDNIVALEDYSFDKDKFWIALELCDEGDLQKYIVKQNPCFETKLDLMLQSAYGVEHLHDIPQVHRDLKPANILLKRLLDNSLQVKIGDFGLAKFVEFQKEQAVLSTVAGTPAFTAPEITSRLNYGISVDVFSLGLVFLAMLKFRPGQQVLFPTIEYPPGMNNRDIKTVGNEMLDAHHKGMEQPELSSNQPGDTNQERALKKLIRKMACFRPDKRIAMKAAVKRLMDMQGAKNVMEIQVTKGFKVPDLDIMVDKAKILGKGGFGKVYKGFCTKTHEPVAVKRMSTDSKHVNDVMKELQMLRKMPSHDNIVAFVDFSFDVDKSECWIVLELCDEGDLQTYFIEKNPIFRTKLDLMLQSAHGVEHMHDVPQVHRDLKPANILIKKLTDNSLQVKICDFGLAKFIESQAVLTTPAGTEPFSAPEILNHLAYDKSVDVFSLGLVFLAMLRFTPEQQLLFPTIEYPPDCPPEIKRKKAVGLEMLEAHRNGMEQPELVRDQKEDNFQELAIKKLIREMACYYPHDRIDIKAVTKQLKDILDQGMQGASGLRKDVPAPTNGTKSKQRLSEPHDITMKDEVGRRKSSPVTLSLPQPREAEIKGVDKKAHILQPFKKYIRGEVVKVDSLLSSRPAGYKLHGESGIVQSLNEDETIIVNMCRDKKSWTINIRAVKLMHKLSQCGFHLT